MRLHRREAALCPAGAAPGRPGRSRGAAGRSPRTAYNISRVYYARNSAPAHDRAVTEYEVRDRSEMLAATFGVFFGNSCGRLCRRMASHFAYTLCPLHSRGMAIAKGSRPHLVLGPGGLCPSVWIHSCASRESLVSCAPNVHPPPSSPRAPCSCRTPAHVHYCRLSKGLFGKLKPPKGFGGGGVGEGSLSSSTFTSMARLSKGLFGKLKPPNGFDGFGSG